MMPRRELIRLCVTLTPAMLVTAFGGLLTTGADSWLALAQGGGIALLLTSLGGLMIATTHNSSLPVSAFAALASFIIRIGGAGVAAVMLANNPYINYAIGALAGCLIATLCLDMWTWSRVAKEADMPLTRVKESARA